MRRLLLVLGLLSVTAFFLAACTGGGEPAEEQPAPAAPAAEGEPPAV
jgi:hypothetical protein